MAQIINYTLIHHEEEPEDNKPVISLASSYNEEQIANLKIEAYQQGYLQGQEEARDVANQQMNDLKKQLEQLLGAIPNAIQGHRLEMQSEISSLVLLIVQGYFVEQAINQHLLETKINQLLLQINKQQTIELYLHPKDIQALQEGLIQLHSSHQQITIKQDEVMALGGFIIKTSHGVFDASIEKQINQLKHQLMSMMQEVRS